MNTNSEQGLIDAIQDQLISNNPPETRTTYERLRAAGFSDDDALNLLVKALSHEMYSTIKEDRDFEPDNFIRLLNKLPHLS